MAITGQIASFRRWQNILRSEGLFTSVRRGFLYFTRYFFRYEALYLYHIDVGNEVSKTEPAYRMQDFSFKIISTNKQVDELIASGFHLDWFLTNADKRLRQGAIAFCIFVGQRLVYISWLTINAQAMASISDIPRPIDFSNKEAYVGWTFRNPKYWRSGSGFTVYVYHRIINFLWHKGIMFFNFEIQKNNKILQNTMAKRLGIKPYREARYLKLLWWKFWQEKPIQATK